jgi:hypothetical protein
MCSNIARGYERYTFKTIQVEIRYKNHDTE